VLALVLGELALRVLPVPDLKVLAAFQDPPESRWRDPAWMDPPDAAFRRHPTIVYEHAPRVYLAVPLAEHDGGSFGFRTNNLGLRRSHDTTIEKAPDVFRVLVLGDSQADGYVDNDENLSTLLEANLAARLAAEGRRLEVLNAGVAATRRPMNTSGTRFTGPSSHPTWCWSCFFPVTTSGTCSIPARL
jgi:hypothetical protein